MTATLPAAPVSVVPASEDLDASRAASLRRVGRALDDLTSLTTVQQLVEHAPAALCRVGFDRAMISRVVDSDWVVERFHSQVDPAHGAMVNELARTENQQLGPNVIELEMVRRRVALLVPDVSREPRVHHRLNAIVHSSSYVAAPIAPEGTVVGFFHADRLDSTPVTCFDRELISLFAQEFGALVATAWLRERFEQLRVTVDELRSSLGGLVNGCLDGQVGLITQSTARDDRPLALVTEQRHERAFKADPDIDRLLSEREREVLRLMAMGDTNGRIASRLVITEGTVKSHVRHILRKLNAANRAEAVCRWLQRPGVPG